MMKIRDMTSSAYPFVLTLIATPPLPPLLPDLVARATDALQQLGAVGPLHWLAPHIAVDIPFNDIDLLKARDSVAAALNGARVDIIPQVAVTRLKKLVLADMDGTIMQEESLDELADVMHKKPEVAAITERAMRGELDFPSALRERVALLKGLPSSALDQTLARLTPMAGAEVLLATLTAHNIPAHLVSGGFSCFTTPVAARLGFTTARGNTLEVKSGVLTGRVIDPILDKSSKLARLQELAPNPTEALTVGDGANDLPMLLAAGTGVAFHAKPAVNAACSVRVQHSDLTALLYIMGLNPLRS